MSRLAPTLAHALAAAPRARGGFTFVRADGSERRLSWRELGAEAARRGLALRARGLARGARVALVVPEGDDFVLAFLGALSAGLVPVPIYPQLGFKNADAYHDTLAHIASAAGASLLVCTAATRPSVEPAVSRVPSLRAVVDVAELAAGPPGELRELPAPSDVAFLQFTSGSTSRPKGVAVTHANLAANAEAFVVHGLDIDPERDRGVSWLPLYHDMGLIGFVIAPVFCGVSITFLPTASFVRSPRLWLEIVHRERGTITFAPNFAFALVSKRLKERDVGGLDLSCLRATGCGAEPIQAKTLREFAARLAPAGFDPRSFLPCYGMAEATLAISFPPRGRWPLAVDVVTPESLREHAPRPAAPGAAGAVEIVSCGRPFPGHELRVVDPETRAPLGERRVGEIEARGPSVCPGYFGEPELTARTLRDGWLRTGDLGYLAAGELYVCGRIKDIIIVRGRNYYPQDIEWVAGELPGVRRGNVVAFGVDVDAEERLVVIAEGTSSDAARLAAEIGAKVTAELGLAVHEARIVPPGTLPRTSSGKPQRAKARGMYLEGLSFRPRSGK